MKVYPDYRRSVYNIPHTIMGILGKKNSKMLDELRDLHLNRLIFVLVDGLGYSLFEKYLADSFEGKYIRLTSLFPSTTAAVLTTLYTGLAPKEHGILEWYMYYEEYGGIIKTLPFSPMDVEENDSLIKMGISPLPLFRHPTIFEQLSSQGIACASYMRREYAHASYSTHMLRGSKIVPYSTMEEAFKGISKDKRDFIYIYLDYLDTMEHAYGPQSKETEIEIKRVFREIERLRKMTDSGIIISADHGQMEIRRKKVLPIKSPVGGSPRDMFIYGEENVEGMEVLSKEDFINLLGPGRENERLKLRAPQKIVLPEDYTGVWFKDFYAKGLHGGLSQEEMYVPFILL